MFSQTKKVTAFSFLELSVVLVIVSFLVAAVTEGQKILKKTTTQATLKQISNYKNHYQDFQMAYFARPGDFASAYSFFDGGSGACGEEADCNGDGDNILETTEDDKNDNETIRAWQHLYLADYIDIEYSGMWNETNSVPRAKITDGYISFVNDGGNYNNNYLKLGAYYDYKNNYSSEGLLYPNDAYKIDAKFDDGLADAGWIMAKGSYGGTSSSSEETFDSDGYSEYCAVDDQYLTYWSDSLSCTLLFTLE